MEEQVIDFGSCLVTRKENYAIVTFNRPEKLNAFGPDLFESLQKVYRNIKNDSHIRAVIFTGKGDHFSAGGDVEQDINPLRGKSMADFKNYFLELGELYMGVYNMEIPTIAAINGYALGAGMELTLICDIRIASETMQIGEFFVRMGLVPEIGMCLLPKIVGTGMAKFMCYTGNLIDAREALRIGLVEQVVPAAELLPAAEKLASKLARGPASIGIMKRAIQEFGDMSLEETLNPAIAYQYQAVHTEDHAEAVTSFLEKRKPKFKGL